MSVIDHIITNSIYNNIFKTAIIQTDIPDHFPITYVFKLKNPMNFENHHHNRYLCNICIINENSRVTFKCWLHETSCDAVKSLDQPNESYITFIETIN